MKTLNLIETQENQYEIATIPEQSEVEKNVVGDYDKARENIQQILEIGHKALEEIAEIATQSQRPDSYDVLAKTINSMIVSNKALLEITKARQEIENSSIKKPEGNKTVNNLFVGSSAELAKLLENIGKK